MTLNSQILKLADYVVTNLMCMTHEKLFFKIRIFNRMLLMEMKVKQEQEI